MASASNGDIIPSHFDGETNYFEGGNLSNNSLRFGEVQEIIYPDDPRSLSKQFIEYSVYVQHRYMGVGAGQLYGNCILINSFGGFADKLIWKLRADNATTKWDGSDAIPIGKGSKVLILCMNGETANSVIIGGIPDSKDKTQEKAKKDDGNFLDFIYNGIKVEISKDGELLIKYGGATKNDGELEDNVDEDTTGTYIKFDKDGNLIGESPGNKVTLLAKEKIELGKVTDDALLGTTYRNNQKTLNNKLKSYFNTSQGLLNTAGTTLNTAATANSTPITGGAAASPSFAAAASALIALSQIMSQMATAIDNFEANANDYLSSKVKLE